MASNIHNNEFTSTSVSHNLFDYGSSDSFSWILQSDNNATYLEQDWLSYGGKVTGLLASDRVCLTDSSSECLDETFEFIAI